MDLRNKFILELRGNQLGNISNQSSSEEIFQNQTLRPILKLQNDLLVAIFINYCIKQKNTFFKLSTNKKIEYIEQNITRNMKFRDFLIGIIIGLFTTEEFELYTKNTSNLNKRLIALVIERLKSQIQIIESSIEP